MNTQNPNQQATTSTTPKSAPRRGPSTYTRIAIIAILAVIAGLALLAILSPEMRPMIGALALGILSGIAVLSILFIVAPRSW